MDDRSNKLLTWAKKDLNDLMNWWANNAVDEVNSGFYGRVRDDNAPDKKADKFIVLNARLVWTFSACYELLKDERYKTLAERTYTYLIYYFYDNRHGGYHTSLNFRGDVLDDRKFMYGNAFAVYGLSEYARVFGDADALKQAKETVAFMDKYMWDAEHKGYYEFASRDWRYTPNEILMQRNPLNQKTMNTHLHIIEAFANLLRADDSKRLRSRVRELLYIFLHKILNRENWHFHYFQTREWAATTPEQSFGHDIEGSWLLYEAAEILGEREAIADAGHACVNMARAVYDDGIAKCGALLSEYDPPARHYKEGFSWWEQNEAVVGFLNAYQMTGEAKFLDASLAALDYIDGHFIDRVHGGWYARVDIDGAPIPDTDKLNGFICPYHNARMDLEIIKRLGKLE